MPWHKQRGQAAQDVGLRIAEATLRETEIPRVVAKLDTAGNEVKWEQRLVLRLETYQRLRDCQQFDNVESDVIPHDWSKDFQFLFFRCQTNEVRSCQQAECDSDKVPWLRKIVESTTFASVVVSHRIRLAFVAVGHWINGKNGS